MYVQHCMQFIKRESIYLCNEMYTSQRPCALFSLSFPPSFAFSFAFSFAVPFALSFYHPPTTTTTTTTTTAITTTLFQHGPCPTPPLALCVLAPGPPLAPSVVTRKLEKLHGRERRFVTGFGIQPYVSPHCRDQSAADSVRQVQ